MAILTKYITDTRWNMVSSLFKNGNRSNYDKRIFMEAILYITKTGCQVVIENMQSNGFIPIRRRWKIERTFAWFKRYRRLTKDFEKQSLILWHLFIWLKLPGYLLE
jgi:transposase